MRYYILASGSKGNSTLIQSGSTNVLIDCGTTKKYLSETLSTIGFSIEDIDALVVTHSHKDHISQLKLFKDIPTYSTFETNHLIQNIISAYESFRVNDLTFYPIALSHDSEDTLGFIIFDGYEKLVYVADTGYIRDQDLLHLVDANYIILESNYDEALLMRSSRPYMTKQRIMSDRGHLSNHQCGQILQQIITKNTTEIVLAHMSQEANNDEVALATVKSYLEALDYEGTITCSQQFKVVMGGQHD